MSEASRGRIFHLQPWSPKTHEVAHVLLTEIQTVSPELEVLFMGAAALKLPGKNDVDLDILCATKDLARYAKLLEPILGHPREQDERSAVWTLYRKGIEVDAILSDPTVSHVPRQLRVYAALKANPQLRETYRQLKIACDGLPFAEYERRKKAFFGGILEKVQL